MAATTAPAAPPDVPPQPGNSALPPWTVGSLPPAPVAGWRTWAALIGPGVMLAGASVGTGEWLFGPAVTAQYGATLLWIATISILCQVFCNLEMMRYTLYCGEPMVVGYFRTPPGPIFWTVVYAILDSGTIWPYNAANAAVPLTAAILGHLPGGDTVNVLGMLLTEKQLVKVMGYAIFLLAFVPLIFGGAIYRMLERVMLFKLIVVLGYLGFVAVFMVSGTNAREVAHGFVRFGDVPLRAETILVDHGFTYTQRQAGTTYTLKGVVNDGRAELFEVVIKDASGRQEKLESIENLSPAVQASISAWLQEATGMCARGKFFVEDHVEEGLSRVIRGRVEKDGRWLVDEYAIAHRKAEQDAWVATPYATLAEVPEAHRAAMEELVRNRGTQIESLPVYMREHNGRLPDLDWMMLASFAAIAGAGGLTNTLFSNYARDKGWGMGANVGAIPSAVGGRNITLSHTGEVFPVTEPNRKLWRGWYRHVLRDQLAVWTVCAFLGMALPCMLSLQFIRNTPVTGNRAAAASAQGMAESYPAYAGILWFATLSVGFLILAPGQVISGDQIARRWSDIIWTASRKAQSLHGNDVKYIYYSIVAVYLFWGLFTLAFFDPLVTAKIGTSIQNVALGVSALHALYVNRTLLPRPLRPNWFMQLGTLVCGLFFLGVSAIVLTTLWGSTLSGVVANVIQSIQQWTSWQ